MAEPVDGVHAEPASAARRRRDRGAGVGGYGMMSFAPSRGSTPPPVRRRGADQPRAARADDAEQPADQPAAGAGAAVDAGPSPVVDDAARLVGVRRRRSSRARSSSTSRPRRRHAARLRRPIKDSSLAPAPVDMQLDVPALPGGDSLVATPTARSDSAMKRILRAVNGGKDLPQRP